MVTARCAMLLAGVVICGTAMADEEVPDIEFLEYLGMWEETDEDWQLFEEETVAENEKRSEPAPEGEASTEMKDEG